MSNLTQLANSAQRKADQAQRTADRHQQRVDHWEREVESRPPRSSARRRAERRLRHNRKLRDRAQQRSDRHRARERDYRARAMAAPPPAPRPPTRRWSPRTPLGKRVAYSLVGAGVLTGIAIGGTNGFNPFDDDSKVVVEVQDAGDADVGNDADDGDDVRVGQPAEPAEDASTSESTSESTPDDGAADATDAGPDADGTEDPATEPGATEDSDTGDDTADTESSESGPTESGRGSDERVDVDDAQTSERVESRTVVPPSETAETTEPSEVDGSQPSQTRTDRVETGPDPALVVECVMYLEEYPELLDIDPLLADLCESDPALALEVIDSWFAELDAYIAAVEHCLMYLESYPALVELDPGLVDWCYEDPEHAMFAIDALVAEWEAAEAAYWAAVDECLWQLESTPVLLELDPTLVDWCSEDPEAALAEIEWWLEQIEIAKAEFHAAMDDCFMYLEDYPELLEIDPGLAELCETDPFTGQSIIGEILWELGYL